MSDARHVLVLASTFPASESDPVPAFVRDQVIAMKALHPETQFTVLAPHDERSGTRDHVVHDDYDEHRFHYAWPRSLEQLTGRGIMPALKANKLLYAAIPLLFIGEYRATLRLARRVKPTLLYAHWFTPQAIVAGWVSKRTGIPFAFTTHASDVEVWRRIPVIGPRLVRSTARAASAMTAVSSRSAAKLTRFLDEPDASRVEIIPMGVEIPAAADVADVRSSSRAELGLGDSLVFLFMGRLVEKKGVPYLLEALAARSAELGDWRLVIAGDGPLADELAAKVTELGLDAHVHFAGYVTGDDKERYLSVADVFVVPSIIASDGDAEGLPVSLLEGLSYGLPCVATFESGADDIVTDGVDGFLCPQADALALGHALVRAAQLDTDAHALLASNARALSTTYSWPAVAARHDIALLGR